MVKLRGPDSEAFKFFCNHLLQNVIGKVEWRTNKAASKIIHMATPSDEAFALLLLENSEERWRDMYVKRNMKSSEVLAKYTNAGDKSKKRHSCKFQGWSNDGLKRFNQLLDIVIANRISNMLWEDEFLQERASIFSAGIPPKRRRKDDVVEERVVPKNDLSYLMMQFTQQHTNAANMTKGAGDSDEETSTEEVDENDDVSLVHHENENDDDEDNE
jgi:hypothetical protein